MREGSYMPNIGSLRGYFKLELKNWMKLKEAKLIV